MRRQQQVNRSSDPAYNRSSLHPSDQTLDRVLCEDVSAELRQLLDRAERVGGRETNGVSSGLYIPSLLAKWDGKEQQLLTAVRSVVLEPSLSGWSQGASSMSGSQVSIQPSGLTRARLETIAAPRCVSIACVFIACQGHAFERQFARV